MFISSSPSGDLAGVHVAFPGSLAEQIEEWPREPRAFWTGGLRLVTGYAGLDSDRGTLSTSTTVVGGRICRCGGWGAEETPLEDPRIVFSRLNCQEMS